MEASVHKIKTSGFHQGLRAGTSIAIGYVPIALTFGLLAKSTGLSLFETLLMSLVVYGGASQYIGLNMFLLGVSPLEMIFTTFIVNIRHLLMSASLNEKVEEEKKWVKAIYAYGITDETFSVAATRSGRLQTTFIFGLTIIAYVSWAIGTGIGYSIGGNLPIVLQEGMAVALYAMFIGLLVPSLKKSMKIALLAIFAAIINSFLVCFELISTGWAIVISTLISATLVELLETTKKGRERSDE